MSAKTADKIATTIFYIVIAIVVVLLALLLGYILYKGGRVISWDFITSPSKTLEAGGGIGPQIFNSFMILIISMIFTIPLGLGSGIYLAEYARPGKLTDAIRLCVETLASLPSIVVGLFGLLVFVNFTGWGYTLLGGALSLTVLNLPVMTRVCEDAVRTVKDELKEASLALGATKWQTITKVILPVALPGILTGIILTSGRVFGEAAAIMYTAGMSSPNVNFEVWDFTNPRSPLNIMRPAETLAVHIWKVNSESLLPDAREVADGSSAVLIIVVLLFNILARWLGGRLHGRLTGKV
ncbi:MAG: phosphate transport system permease protein [Clostridiales bacterium]|nr:phosphate transport system permease protein [Clostridiales bacterium]